MFGGVDKTLVQRRKYFVFRNVPSDTIEKYDIVRNCWSKLEVKLPTKYLYSLAKVNDDQVLLFAAGEKREDESHVLEDYTWHITNRNT